MTGPRSPVTPDLPPTTATGPAAPQPGARPVVGTAPAPSRPSGAATLPWSLRAAILLRSLAIQGSWNYETMLGNGVAFVMEPALRRLPGGRGGEPYRAAMARQCRYFNAHPYLAMVAVGALIRAELDGEQPERIERFRAALCGPLGSCGDRLVWAAWLPLCALLGLVVWGLGGGPLAAVGTFVLIYNVGHIVVRAWALRVGLRDGLRVAAALGTPWMRRGPELLGRLGALLAGVVLPLATLRAVGPSHVGVAAAVLLVGALVGGLLVRVQGRWEGWRLALPLLLLLVLFSVTV